ncbi:hypothetical protein RchiOBHm_Chr1g0328581 [Rosa chinensis]|uniref:Uncharacterized protein n=1 Tax=Rosa chinensis TaxID=74649 RepID=A0A2P6SAS7_ROSCH|nr:hypothetical protein RchiOBHm_Chr1g0328581 [Rosa chinensis]
MEHLHFRQLPAGIVNISLSFSFSFLFFGRLDGANTMVKICFWSTLCFCCYCSWFVTWFL